MLSRYLETLARIKIFPNSWARANPRPTSLPSPPESTNARACAISISNLNYYVPLAGGDDDVSGDVLISIKISGAEIEMAAGERYKFAWIPTSESNFVRARRRQQCIHSALRGASLLSPRRHLFSHDEDASLFSWFPLPSFSFPATFRSLRASFTSDSSLFHPHLHHFFTALNSLLSLRSFTPF